MQRLNVYRIRSNPDVRGVIPIKPQLASERGGDGDPAQQTYGGPHGIHSHQCTAADTVLSKYSAHSVTSHYSRQNTIIAASHTPIRHRWTQCNIQRSSPASHGTMIHHCITERPQYDSPISTRQQHTPTAPSATAYTHVNSTRNTDHRYH